MRLPALVHLTCSVGPWLLRPASSLAAASVDAPTNDLASPGFDRDVLGAEDDGPGPGPGLSHRVVRVSLRDDDDGGSGLALREIVDAIVARGAADVWRIVPEGDADEAKGYAAMLVGPEEHRLLRSDARLSVSVDEGAAEMLQPRPPAASRASPSSSAGSLRGSGDDRKHYEDRQLEEAGDSIPNFPCYRSVTKILADVQALAAAHPDIASVTDIGDSWEKTQNLFAGHDILALRLTNFAKGDVAAKPPLFLTCGVHAREYTPPELCLRFAERLVGGYGVDADATWVLDHHQVVMIPLANPDGRIVRVLHCACGVPSLRRFVTHTLLMQLTQMAQQQLLSAVLASGAGEH